MPIYSLYMFGRYNRINYNAILWLKFPHMPKRMTMCWTRDGSVILPK